MKLVEINEIQFKEYSNSHELKSFLQTVNMGNIQKAKGNRVFYLAMMQDDNILCASMIIGTKTHFGYYYSAPRGFLIDYHNKTLLESYTEKVAKFLKMHGGYILNIEPKILYQQRDINGDVVDGGFNNQTIVDNLINLGFKHNGFYIELDLSKQVRWAFVLDYNGQSEDEIFNNFKGNTRNLIRKAIKHQVKIKELNYDQLSDFKKVVDSTGVRKNFDARPLSYYQTMYKNFHDDGYLKYLVATIDIDEYIATLTQEKIQNEDKLAKLKDLASNAGKRKEYGETINGLDKKLKEAAIIKAKYGQEIILAGAMFMIYGDESVYLYSGSYEELMMFNGQYLIQWQMIKDGIAMGLKRHNFYGISGDFSKSNKRWGVYEFKKGFGGQVIEYIGDFDLVLNPIKYRASQLIKKVRG